MFPHKKKARQNDGQQSKQQPHRSRRNATSRDQNRDHGNPARHAAESTDGNGTAKDGDNTSPAPSGHPTAKSHRRHTRRRAATSAGNAKTEADDKARSDPGTKDARPAQKARNGQTTPAQDENDRPGTESQPAKQHRQRGTKNADTTNTSAEKSRQRRAPRRQQPHGAPNALGTPPSPAAASENKRARSRPFTARAVLSCCGGEHVLGLWRSPHNGRPVRPLLPLPMRRRMDAPMGRDNPICMDAQTLTTFP